MIYSARSSFKNIHIFWCEKFGIKNGVTLSLKNRKYDSFVFFLFVSLKYKDFFLPRDPYNTHIIQNRTAPQFTFSWQVIFSELTSNSKWLRIFLVKTLVWFFFSRYSLDMSLCRDCNRILISEIWDSSNVLPISKIYNFCRFFMRNFVEKKIIIISYYFMYLPTTCTNMNLTDHLKTNTI